jgi:hypothetical protein
MRASTGQWNQMIGCSGPLREFNAAVQTSPPEERESCKPLFARTGPDRLTPFRSASQHVLTRIYSSLFGVALSPPAVTLCRFLGFGCTLSFAVADAYSLKNFVAMSLTIALCCLIDFISVARGPLLAILGSFPSKSRIGGEPCTPGRIYTLSMFGVVFTPAQYRGDSIWIGNIFEVDSLGHA